MKFPALIALCAALSAPAFAADLSVSVQVPALKVAEYHRPYVAIWVEKEDQSVAANLAIWYQVKTDGKEPGTKWLPDLRQWWRKSGRSLKVPVDGITAPTRPVGKHALKLDEKHPALAKLPAGNYTLVVEAVREVGGRELLKIPFEWKGKKPSTGSVQGKEELGAVSLSAKP